MNDAVVVIPVLARPERVEGLLWSLRNGQGDRPYRWLFVVSPHDEPEVEELRRHRADFLVAPFACGPGDWAKKINLGFRETSEPFVFLGADDVCFCPGWLDRALECAAATNVGVIGTNDLGNDRVTSGRHSTHPLIRRSYIDEQGTIDEPGKVVHDGYDHNYADDELVATAQARHQWYFCGKSWVEHLHPHWGKGTDDATYRKGQARFNDDRTLFARRSALWAPDAR